MIPRATILIPTHDHGPTLRYSVGSALAQTVRDLEVFVIGDGAPDETRDLMEGIVRTDARVRYFDHPKGPRHGELHRHAALAGAQGRIVCYLADDDLFLPDHVETMDRLLRDADFAHSLPTGIHPDGSIDVWIIDLARTFYRRLMLSGRNRIPLSCGAHTLAFYRALPHGWRTTPAGTHTDLYMWQQFLSIPGVRAASGMRPTSIHFPGPERRGVPIRRRVEELERWCRRLGHPGGPQMLRDEVAEFVARECARLDETYQRVERSAPVRLSRWIVRRSFRRPAPDPLSGPSDREGGH